MESETEEWRDVVGYEGLYMVSNLGRTISMEKSWPSPNGGVRHKEKSELRQCNGSDGYLRVCLRKDNSQRLWAVHILVAKAFVENTSNKPQVDHMDGSRNNNNASNLRWCTASENSLNPITRIRKSECMSGVKHHQYGKIGKLSKRSKPILQFNVSGELIREWDSASDVQRSLGYLCNCISSCCKQGRKTSYGFVWKLK